MEHVVFFHGQDGSEQYRRAAGLEEAVRHVEHLRNADGVEDCRVYSLAEVPLRVKTVYVVEMPETAASAEPVAEEPAAPEASEPEPEPEPVMANPLAELTVPAMPETQPVAAMPEEQAVPGGEFAPVDVPAEPVVSNGSSTGPRGLGFFAR